AGSLLLATVHVPTQGTGSPYLTGSPSYTVASGGLLPVTDDAELPGASGGLYDGAVRWNRSLDEVEVHDGQSTWERIAPRVQAVEVSECANQEAGSTNFSAGGTPCDIT